MQLCERRRFSFIAQTLLDQSHISQVCNLLFYLLACKWITGCFKSWVIFQIFRVVGWKYILNWIEHSGLKSKMLYCIRFHVFYLILSDNSPFLFAQMTLCWPSFFQLFIVLGICNFVLDTDVISGSAVQSFEIHYPAIVFIRTIKDIRVSSESI